MVLTTKQNEGLQLVLNKYRNNEKFAIISGYANWIKLLWSN